MSSENEGMSGRGPSRWGRGIPFQKQKGWGRALRGPPGSQRGRTSRSTGLVSLPRRDLQNLLNSAAKS